MLKHEKLYDTATLIETHQADADFIKLMISLFVKNMSESNTNLYKATKEENWQQVHFAAHKMKASIDLFNLNQLRDTIRRIEQRARKLENTESIAEDVSIVYSYVKECIADMKDDFKL